MKHIECISTALLVLTAQVAVQAQGVFDSGSDGSDGPLIIEADTVLPLPPDGIINATRVQVQPGATLSFGRNANNTSVILLATESVIIEGKIFLAGESNEGPRGGAGGPGGYAGGDPPSLDVPAGDGFGPGGGKGSEVRKCQDPPDHAVSGLRKLGLARNLIQALLRVQRQLQAHG